MCGSSSQINSSICIIWCLDVYHLLCISRAWPRPITSRSLCTQACWYRYSALSPCLCSVEGILKKSWSSRCRACYDRFITPPLALGWPGDVPLRQRLGWEKQEHGRIYWRQFRCEPVQEFVSASNLAGSQHHLHREWGASLWHGGAWQTVQPLFCHPKLAQCVFALWIFWQQLLPM